VLREELDLTGAKYGCGEGVCGACTVLVAGEPARSCVLALRELAGREVTTVEGLAGDGRLHPVQQAFIEVGAMQCGYCTPGMLISAVALLARDPDPDEQHVRASMEGNVCRCCTYPRIVRAVRRAAELATAETPPASPERVTEGRPVAEPRAPVRAPWDLVRPAEREYFAALPDGLVVVLPPGQTPLARRGADPGPWLANGGAWVHIGATGTVTAFTDRVDVGQGSRTELSVLVAEELRAPLEAVRMVMADTDVSPFDLGTFGSRTTPEAADYLRATAATAREVLLSTAAERWGARAATLVAGDGRIWRQDGTSIPYGELVRGLRRVETASIQAPMTPAPAWRIAGRPTSNVTATEIVTGTKRYPSDVSSPGVLHGKVLRPPALGATLRSVDITRASEIAGVTVVHEDSFVGVAAPDLYTAKRALDAVRARWETQPMPSESELFEHLRSHPVEVEGWGGAVAMEAGDVESELVAAPLRLASTYTTAYIAHVPLETRVVLAQWDAERLTIWTGTQQPFNVRREVAEALGLEERRVRVVVPDTGGGFGGKHTAETAIEAARLARASGRPVKLRWTREEEFSWAYFRPAALIDVRSAARADGQITAWEFKNYNAGAAAISCPYEIPNQRIDFQPSDSPLRQGPYRALAATANTFARESHIDELAHELGDDPLELRLRHLRDDRLAAVLQAAAQRAGWRRGGDARGLGMGIAAGIEKGGRVATCAHVRVHEDRRLEILSIASAFECGAIVNPDNLTNQIEGATAMGLGGALFEAVHFDGERILNASMSSYRVPRFGDVPPIDVVLIDRPDLPSAGAGETPIIAVAPAIANAIFAASELRIRSLPLAPHGLLG
jgi:CO/xanthine dehydrogenase Mo-binding subunit/aerobic-type carbon monoxide dehydrogenase small subunit (CoxS/CutS family)